MIRVLLVDDEELVRTGLRMILDAEPDIAVAGDAANGADALARIPEVAPDVVVMDIRMPRMDGLEATRRICSDASGPKVVLLTTFDLDEHVYAALAAGASGFLLTCSPKACRTPRSPNASWSATPPSRPTSPASSPNSASATESKP
jgi:YesN/AraC family two-component response regulator